MHVQQILEWILVASLVTLAADDPECYQTSGSNIVYKGSCTNDDTVTVYIKEAKLNVKLDLKEDAFVGALATVKLGGCSIDLKVFNRTSGNDKIFKYDQVDEVASIAARPNGVKFDSKTACDDVKFEDVSGDGFMVDVSITLNGKFGKTTILFQDATFTAPPVPFYKQTIVLIIGGGVGSVALLVVSCAIGLGGYFYLKRRNDKKKAAAVKSKKSKKAKKLNAPKNVEPQVEKAKPKANEAKTDDHKEHWSWKVNPMKLVTPIWVMIKELWSDDSDVKTAKGDSCVTARSSTTAITAASDVTLVTAKSSVSVHTAVEFRDYGPQANSVFLELQPLSSKLLVGQRATSLDIAEPTAGPFVADKPEEDLPLSKSTEVNSREALTLELFLKVTSESKTIGATTSKTTTVITVEPPSEDPLRDAEAIFELTQMAVGPRRLAVYFQLDVNWVGRACGELATAIRNKRAEAAKNRLHSEWYRGSLARVKELGAICDDVVAEKTGKKAFPLPWTLKAEELSTLSSELIARALKIAPLTDGEIGQLKLVVGQLRQEREDKKGDAKTTKDELHKLDLCIAAARKLMKTGQKAAAKKTTKTGKRGKKSTKTGKRGKKSTK